MYTQEGLSPCHLKKAKLMFFYARYPSSNTLKTYFPDVKVCVGPQRTDVLRHQQVFCRMKRDGVTYEASAGAVLSSAA